MIVVWTERLTRPRRFRVPNPQYRTAGGIWTPVYQRTEGGLLVHHRLLVHDTVPVGVWGVAILYQHRQDGGFDIFEQEWKPRRLVPLRLDEPLCDGGTPERVRCSALKGRRGTVDCLRCGASFVECETDEQVRDTHLLRAELAMVEHRRYMRALSRLSRRRF